MAHAEETPNVVEYSLTLAGNAAEKANPKTEESGDGDGDNEDNQENVQIPESEPESKWYENDKKNTKIDYNSLDKAQKMELSHEAMVQGQ